MSERAAAPTLARLIDRCVHLRQLQQVHASLITSPSLHPAAVLTRLLLATTSAGASFLPYATAIFRCLPSLPTLFDFNAMIRAHSPFDSPALSPISLYAQLLASGLRPDHFTFPFLFKHCSRRLDLFVGQSFHGHVVKLGFHSDVYVQNATIFMYSKCGLPELARKVFDDMPVRDIVSWNSILIGYLRCGELDLSLEMFHSMEERNVVTWNSIITGFVQGCRPNEAMGLFREMLLLSDERVKPDKVTAASVITACSCLGALDQGRWVHGHLKRHGMEFDVVIRTALIDMYGKCGCVEKAREVFEEMPTKDVLAWTAMIAAFAIHGLAEDAFHMWEEMERHGDKPNYVTFGALLNACAHAGLVEEGRWCFDRMQGVYLIEPQLQHYASMVDLLGRAGLFGEAEKLIASMPMEPDSFVWGALLGACRAHGNIEVGERVANHLISFDPLNHVFYVILSDIYAKANRFEDVKKVRSFMKNSGINKTVPGCSMIEVDGKVLEFSAKRALKDLPNEIEWVLYVIDNELKRNFDMEINQTDT